MRYADEEIASIKQILAMCAAAELITLKAVVDGVPEYEFTPVGEEKVFKGIKALPSHDSAISFEEAAGALSGEFGPQFDSAILGQRSSEAVANAFFLKVREVMKEQCFELIAGDPCLYDIVQKHEVEQIIRDNHPDYDDLDRADRMESHSIWEQDHAIADDMGVMLTGRKIA